MGAQSGGNWNYSAIKILKLSMYRSKRANKLISTKQRGEMKALLKLSTYCSKRANKLMED